MEERKYIIDDEQLMKEWNWKKNNKFGFNPATINCNNSKKKVWWICEKGHEWSAVSYHRIRGVGCPYCSGKYAITGENDLQTLCPELMEEWDWERNFNLGLNPSKLKKTSNVRVWWKCKKHNHSYNTLLSARTHSEQGCPYCSGARILSGFNDLQTIYPEIAKDWDYELNGDVTSNQVAPKSHKKYWWKCNSGHSYYMSVQNKVKGCQCQYCCGRMVLQGFNDLATTHPNILKEWDYDKNDILPTQVSAGSHTKVWWKCDKGHSWQATIKNRVNGSGCKECNKVHHTSFPERAIYYYIQQYFNDAEWGYKQEELGRYEIDVYIPSKQIGIEYDGQGWHQDIKRDLAKDNICNKLDIHLIRLREPECPIYETNAKLFYLKGFSNTDLENAIDWLLRQLDVLQINVNIDRDMIQIEELVEHYEIEHSLARLYPEIAKEWHPTKNGNLTPEQVSYGSHMKVWWLCPNGHDYNCIIKDRTGKGVGCRYCKTNKNNTK